MFQKKKNFYGLLVILAATTTILSSANLVQIKPAQACRPGRPQSPISERVEKTPVVFDGTVIRIVENTVVVRVNRYFKGIGPKVISLTGFNVGHSCSQNIRDIGSRYVFFTESNANNQPWKAIYDGAWGAAPSYTSEIEAELAKLELIKSPNEEGSTNNLPSEIFNKIAKETTNNYAGQLKKIVKAERVPYPYYCEELRAGKPSFPPLTCDPPGIKDTWKIIAETYFERLTYYVRDNGNIKLSAREYLSKSNKIPSQVEQIVFQDANKNWGLPANAGKVVSVRETLKAIGIDATSLPIEPKFEGQTSKEIFWEIIIEHNQIRWIYFVNKNNPHKFQLWSRLNYAEKVSLPSNSALTIFQAAAANLNLNLGQILITKVEPMNFDGCLGLAVSWQNCPEVLLSGYRVTVEGKNSQRYFYRINKQATLFALEGTPTMPPRRDSLSNALAAKILQDASDRLKTAKTDLLITNIQTSTACISQNIQTHRNCEAKVIVSNGQKQLSYLLDKTWKKFISVK
jgi:hypothetical protein